MNIAREMVYLGSESKDEFKKEGEEFKKTGNTYEIVRFADGDGDIVEFKVSDDKMIAAAFKLKQLEKVLVNFTLSMGRFLKVTLNSLAPITK